MAEIDPVNPNEVPEIEEIVTVTNAFVVPDEVVVVPEEVVVVTESVILDLPPNRPRKVYAGMWGPAEIGVVTAGIMTLLAAFILYFLWVVPSNSELVKNRSEAERLEAELASAKSKYGEITSTESQVAKIVASVDDFETRSLPIASNGRTALYQRLNGLIAAYGLSNTTGPDYAPLEEADANTEQESDEEKGRSKYRSLFPGVYVTTTLEGSYHNLRRFIREIETGREFIVVSAVELAPSDSEQQNDQTKPNPAPGIASPNTQVSQNFPSQNQQGFPGQVNVSPQGQQSTVSRPKGKAHGETVTLRIEMAAYFRRPNFVPALTDQSFQ